jgi:uncharacterized protein YkwD
MERRMALLRLQIGLAVASVAAAVAVVGPTRAASTPAHAARTPSALEAGVLRELNAVRAAHRLRPVRLNGELGVAAGEHSREMIADGYFEHASHDGTAFWKRIGRWYVQAGYARWSVGENLLWSSPDVSPSAAVARWMASPEHRANILGERWREVGVSAIHVARAPGAFRGLPVTIITTDFGARS